MKTRFLAIISGLLMITALYMVFIYVPADKETGVIQRIFYFHVPLAWVAFLALFFTFLGSILYLWKRADNWHFLASSSAKLGLLLLTLMLITGSIWAKAVWGVWWVWEPRLTTSLVLWLIYLAYFIVPAYVTTEEQRRRFAAIIGIIGFLDVPIVAVAISLWRTQHPGAIIFKGGLVSSMLLTLLVCIIAFTALHFLLLTGEISLKKDENEIKILKRTRSEE